MHLADPGGQRAEPFLLRLGDHHDLVRLVNGAIPPVDRGDPGDDVDRRGKPFRQAYLIELFQDMIGAGVAFHQVETAGEYMEVDTQEDYDLARTGWTQEG